MEKNPNFPTIEPENIVRDEDVPYIGSGAPDYISMADVSRSTIIRDLDDAFAPNRGAVIRFISGFEDNLRQTRKIKDSIVIFGGQGAMAVGGYFGEDSALTTWGRQLVQAGARNVDAINDDIEHERFPLTAKERDTWAYKIGSGFSNIAQMLVLNYATGGLGGAAGLSTKAAQTVGKVSAVGGMSALELSGETEEGIDVYRQRTGDKDLQNYSAAQAKQEFNSTLGYTIVAGALENINLGKFLPILREGKKPLLNGVKAAVTEGITEFSQELANIGFDLIDGTIDFSQMPDRLYGAFEEGVVGAIVGGSTAGAFSVYNRAKIKNILREELGGTVPAKDLNAVVDAVYEDGMATMAGFVVKELALSEELRNKHGDVFNAMQRAVDRATQESGAFTDNDVDRAQYVTETAAMFADQVLAEANFRKVPIDDVLKASQIVYEDGGIVLNTESVPGAEAIPLNQAMYETKKKTIGEFFDDVINGNNPKKRYFSHVTNDGVMVNIPSDTILHDQKKHRTTLQEWENILENLDNVESIGLSNKAKGFSDNSLLLEVNTPLGKYGVVIALGKNQNIISTVFKSTGDKGVEAWIKEKTAKAPAPHPQAGSSSVINNGDVVLGQSLKTIISNIRQEINSPLEQRKKASVIRGSFDPSANIIRLTENANYSTLPHEFAHYWLSRMEKFVDSGAAGQGYRDRYLIAREWLGLRSGQRIGRRAQEQFAQGYERFLLDGNLPQSPMNLMFQEYDKWLKRVYVGANQPSKKPLTKDMVRFFQSMTTGVLPPPVHPPVDIVPEREAAQVPLETVSVETGTSDASPVSERAIFETPQAEQVEANQGRASAAAERQQNILRVQEKLSEEYMTEINYNPITFAESSASALDIIENRGVNVAKEMIDGVIPMPDRLLRTALMIAYEQAMIKQGNIPEYLRVLQKHTLEQTRRGQEISAERMTGNDISDLTYWVRRAIAGRKEVVGIRLKKTKDSFKNVSGEKAVDLFVQENTNKILKEAEKVESLESREQAVKDGLNKLKADNGLKGELFQSVPDGAYSSFDAMYDFIAGEIEGLLNVKLTESEVTALQERQQELQKSYAADIEAGRGNPSVETMRKVKEMNDLQGALNPSNALSLWSNSVGRAAMLMSVKSTALNIISNFETFVTESLYRRIQLGSFEKAVNTEAVKDYLKYDMDVYKTSGVMMSVVRPETVFNPLGMRGENILTSQGDGVFRKIARFSENIVYQNLLGFPDAVSKAYSFVDRVNLEATKIAKSEGLTGEALTARATEIFNDAALYNPKTDLGIKIRENAINDAEVATYTNSGQISEWSLKARNLINTATGSLRIGDIVMPFVKTPANVIALGLDYSVGLGRAALSIPQILNDVRNRNLSDKSRNAINSSIRNGIGVGLAALIAMLFDADDYIPDYDLAVPREKELARLKNAPYNSLKIGNTYYSLDYFGALATPLVALLMAKKEKDGLQAFSKYLQGVIGQSAKIPGIKELYELIGFAQDAAKNSTEKTAEDILNNTVDGIFARVVPSIISDIGKITDDYERDASGRGILGRLTSRLPVVREALPERRNLATGRRKETESALKSIFFGARVKTANDNALVREISRLYENDEYPALRDVTKSGALASLSDEKRIEARNRFASGFTNRSGRRIEGYADQVNRLIRTENYRNSTDSEKKVQIDKIRRKIVDELKKTYGIRQK